VIAIVLCAYFALPKRFQLKPDWQEAALNVLIVSVLVTAGWRSLWRDIVFWIALIISAAIQLAAVHACVKRVGELGRGGGKLATLLGFVLFFAIYALMKRVQRNFYGEASPENR
jgi:hypothetical protein